MPIYNYLLFSLERISYIYIIYKKNKYLVGIRLLFRLFLVKTKCYKWLVYLKQHRFSYYINGLGLLFYYPLSMTSFLVLLRDKFLLAYMYASILVMLIVLCQPIHDQLWYIYASYYASPSTISNYVVSCLAWLLIVLCRTQSNY